MGKRGGTKRRNRREKSAGTQSNHHRTDEGKETERQALEPSSLRESPNSQQHVGESPAASASSITVSVVHEAGQNDDEPTTDLSIPPPYPIGSVLRDDDDAENNTQAHGSRKIQELWRRLEKKRKNRKWIPTEIQLQAWPILLERQTQRLVAIAPVGSGKTLAYGIPLILKAQKSLSTTSAEFGTSSTRIRSIVLVPTRELAQQVEKELSTLIGKKKKEKDRDAHHVAVSAVYGGVDKALQLSALREENPQGSTNHILCATPGRLLDIIDDDRDHDDDHDEKNSSHEDKDNRDDKSNRRNTISLRHIESVVFDEADRLALNTDMSNQVSAILQRVDLSKTQISLFSATYPNTVIETWSSWMNHQSRVWLRVNTMTLNDTAATDKDSEELFHRNETAQQTNNEPENTNRDHKKRKYSEHNADLNLARIPSHVTQTLHVCAAHKRPAKLLKTLQRIRHDEKSANRTRNRGLCLIFFARIKTLQYIQKLLTKEGIVCSELHSHLHQRQRDQTLRNFRAGKIVTLLATDIAARGLHVNHLEYVINYDFPVSLELYVHRCGRAGRSQVVGSSNDATSEQCSLTESTPSFQAAKVYSFFSRELAPMAKDVVSLLQASNAWVDPNLLTLVDGASNNSKGSAAAEKTKKKRAKKAKEKDFSAAKEANQQKPTQDQSSKSNSKDDNNDDGAILSDEEDDDGNDGMFNYLNPKRIMLKRASHVSSASSSDEEGEDDDCLV